MTQVESKRRGELLGQWNRGGGELISSGKTNTSKMMRWKSASHVQSERCIGEKSETQIRE